MKRYFVMYESDRPQGGHWNHPMFQEGNWYEYGLGASTIKTAKGYINKIRKEQAAYNPRNFRIYDSYAEVDPETNHVPCVHEEAA